MAKPDAEALIAPVVERAAVITVVTLQDAADGAPLAAALARGGAPVVEITLRTPAGLEAVRRAAAEAPQACVGAGTCLTPADLEAAKAAGAAFAVSPGLSRELTAAADALELPYLPGVATASDVMAALAQGRRTLKFFPAVPAGGAAYMGALAGPFPGVRFCPTGGLTAQTAGSFLDLPNVVCVGGSWLAPGEAVARRAWDEVESLARAAVSALRR